MAFGERWDINSQKLAPDLSQLQGACRRTHKQLKPLQGVQPLQMTEQIIIAQSQLPILHFSSSICFSLPRRVFLLFRQFFMHQAMPSPKLIRRSTLAWDTESYRLFKCRLLAVPISWRVCLRSEVLAFVKPEVTLQEFVLQKGQFLLLRLFRNIPKDDWVQFLLHHTGGLQHPVHVPYPELPHQHSTIPMTHLVWSFPLFSPSHLFQFLFQGCFLHLCLVMATGLGKEFNF